jgi:hypothetical protein
VVTRSSPPPKRPGCGYIVMLGHCFKCNQK